MLSPAAARAGAGVGGPATVIAVVAGGLLARQGDTGQPAVIAAAVTSYRTGHLDGSAATLAPPPVRQAQGVRRVGGGSTVTRVGQMLWRT